ncbi:MAG: hypothetical protein GX660_18720 [Clostridiaceae bacterium]|nr:hypothetical protein [Clostridiaceae bacterium]
MASIHQANHPGQEMKISYRIRNKHLQDFYFYENPKNKGVRLWNRCNSKGKPQGHKRKFIEIKGSYIEDIVYPKEEKGLLRFWGEYEGHSEFELLQPLINEPYWNSPCAVHRPFFCKQNINDQNTDPYIFGNNLYYAICKKGKLINLEIGDLILFGSEFGSKDSAKFYLDTLFVIENEIPSIINSSFDEIFIESTLKRIGLSNCTNGTMPIHIGKKFCCDNNIFSFFPAKVSNNEKSGFGRPVIDTVNLGLLKPGARTGAKSKRLENNENIFDIWKNIAQSVVNQGFVLGIHTENLCYRTNI